MPIHPVHDRILAKRLPEENVSAGGIIIPDQAKEKPIRAEVVAVGPGRRDERGELVPISVKAGDRVLFGKYSGTEITVDGEDHLILRDDDVLAVIG